MTDASVLNLIPDTVGIPLRGTVHNPQLDTSALGGIFAKAIRDGAVKGGLNGLLNGGKGGGNGGGGGNNNPFGGLLKGLGKKR